MRAYYNDNDPFCAQWLKNLIKAGEIAPGEVDERGIEDVQAVDLVGYDRCHFFAGIAGWDYALRLAGWPEGRPVWTGSCPCQPFSTAGKQKKGKDERHLWPEWFRLIRECRPPIILGEQVSGKGGLSWLDIVFADLEAIGYASGAVDIPAGLFAPHQRNRLWFVALDESRGTRTGEQTRNLRKGEEKIGKIRFWDDAVPASAPGELGNAEEFGSGTGLCDSRPGEERGLFSPDPSPTGGVDHAASKEDNQKQQRPAKDERRRGADSFGRCSMANPYRTLLWLPCRDGRLRPTERLPESEFSALADGLSHSLGYVRAETDQGEGILYLSPLIEKTFSRVGRLRDYGNSINVWCAKLFIEVVMEWLSDA